MKIPEPLPVKRISMQTIFQSIISSLILEKGFFFTVREMLLRPGQALQKILFSLERSRFVKPLPFLLFCVGLSVLVSIKAITWSNGVEIIQEAQHPILAPEAYEAASSKLLNIALQYQNLSELLKVPFLAMLTWWLFRSSRLNFAEHLVINAYALAIQALFSTLLLPMGMFISLGFLSINLIAIFAYYIYVYQQVFQQQPLWLGIIKSAFASIIAYVLTSLMLGILLVVYFNYIDYDPDILTLVNPLKE